MTTEREYLDFEIDGQRLHTILKCGDVISSLGWGAAEEQVRKRNELLLRAAPQLASGRVEIFVCPECGDLGCGAITVRVERRGQEIWWYDFAYENGYEPERTQQFAAQTSFRFESEDYERVFSLL